MKKMLLCTLKKILRPFARPLLNQIRLIICPVIPPPPVPVPRKLPGVALEKISSPYSIVDVGAKLLGTHLYQSLIQNYQTDIVGFDPTVEASEQALPYGGRERVLPYFIGNGEKTTLYLTDNPYGASKFYPNLNVTDRFYRLMEGNMPKSSVEIDTRKLDDIKEITACDLLKIDVQGAELEVLQSGDQLLEKVLFVFVEVEFLEFYKNQPLFSHIDQYLAAKDFQFLKFSRQHAYVKFSRFDAVPACSTWPWDDAIYMRDFQKMTSAELLKSAVIANDVFEMYDLAALLLEVYDVQHGTAYAEAYAAQFTS